MISKVLVSGILLIVLICVLVFVVEFFLPLSVKADMNMLCRSTLLKMEADGGLSEAGRLELQAGLENKGLEAVVVSGTPHARQGERLTLHVGAIYRYSRLAALFTRSGAVREMGYDRVSMSRKVVN